MIPKPFEDQQDTALVRFGAPQFAPSFIHARFRYGVADVAYEQPIQEGPWDRD